MFRLAVKRYYNLLVLALKNISSQKKLALKSESTGVHHGKINR